MSDEWDDAWSTWSDVESHLDEESLDYESADESVSPKGLLFEVMGSSEDVSFVIRKDCDIECVECGSSLDSHDIYEHMCDRHCHTRKYRVTVRRVTYETWEIDARDEDEAESEWYNGLHYDTTDDEEEVTEVELQ